MHLLKSLTLTTAFALLVVSAHANYIATLNQVGSNVVGSGSGFFDLAAFGPPGNFTGNGSVVNPSLGLLTLGMNPNPGGLTDGYPISGPTTFGGGTGANADPGGTGPIVGVSGSIQTLFVPKGYISNTPLGLSTDTWSNATFASLGLNPGTYTWTWGSGPTADSYTLQIGPATNGVPDSGSTIALMLAAVAPLIAFRSKLLARG